MTVPVQKLREIVFQILFSHDLGGANTEESVALLMKELMVNQATMTKALQRALMVLTVRKEIDEMVAKASFSYDFDRIQAVERNVLRLGVFELLFDEEIPPKVAISEAMRLSRKFSSPEAAHFVNAILDSLYKASQGQTPDETTLRQTAAKLVESEAAAKQAQAESKQEE